jgi:excisionase family DNA binding protein
MTLKQAADKLGTSPDNLRGAIRRKALKAEKIGRDWFVSPDEVERYGRENRRGQS